MRGKRDRRIRNNLFVKYGNYTTGMGDEKRTVNGDGGANFGNAEPKNDPKSDYISLSVLNARVDEYSKILPIYDFSKPRGDDGKF